MDGTSLVWFWHKIAYYYSPCPGHRGGFRVAALPGDDFPGRVERDCFGQGGGDELFANLPLGKRLAAGEEPPGSPY